MALTAVDLSLTSKRITPTLSHDLILGDLTKAVGSRGGVASLQVVKNLIGAGVTVSASAPVSPTSGLPWWDTSGNPDAGLKVRIGSSWHLVVGGSRVVAVLEALTGTSQLSGQYVRISASGFNQHLSTTDNTVQKIAQKLDDLTIPTLPGLVSQAQAEAGTVTGTRLWSPLRVAQAIAALAAGGGGSTTNADIDARIISWALANSPSGHAPINRGGTGSNTASGARTSLGLGTAAQRNVGTGSGNVITLALNGFIPIDRLATGPSDNTECLRGNQTWGPINHPIVTQAEAEAGTSLGYRVWSPQRVAQAIAALAAGGSGGGITISATAPTGASNGDLWWDTAGTVDAGLKVRVSSSWVSVVDPRVSPWAQLASPTGFAPISRGGTNSGTAVGARGQLGLGTVATRDSGIVVGAVPLLGTGGLLAAARMGSGTASISRFLRGDRTWVDPRPTTVSQAEAEEGTSGSIRSWTPVRVSQAIAALAGDGTSTTGPAGPPGWSASIDAAYRDPDSGVLPQFEIIIASGGTRIIELDHLNDDDARYVTEMIEGTIIQIGEHSGNRFTVDADAYSENNGEHRISGNFDDTTPPTLTNGDDYRLLFTQARKGADGTDGADGTGGGGAASLVAFKATLAATSIGLNSTAWLDILTFADTGIRINEGSFTDGDPVTGRKSVIIPDGEDGVYQIGLNTHLTSTSTVRYNIRFRIVVYRDDSAGDPQLLADPQTIGGAYYRGVTGNMSAQGNLVATGDLEGGDEIRVQARLDAGAVATFNVSAEGSSIWVNKLLGTSESGQESEADTNNGNTFIRLYRKVQADGGIPADPGPAYTGGEYVALTAFGLWKPDPPALSSTQVLWVANGGTSLDSDGNVQNRAWQVYVALVEQYAEIIQDNDTYSLTLTDDSRFVRSFTTTGPGAWSRIAGGTDGWIDLVTTVAAHNQHSLNGLLTYTLPGRGFDATYFEEIEIEVAAYGLYDAAQSNPVGHLGVIGNVKLRRIPGVSWTLWGVNHADSIIAGTVTRGSHKCRVNDEIGFTVSRLGLWGRW